MPCALLLFLYNTDARAAEAAQVKMGDMQLQRPGECRNAFVTIRHTTATYLLRAGTDINIDTIRAWLGHVLLATTNVYAQIDLQMKARAMAHLEPSGKPPKHRMGSDLMQFLRSL